MVPDTYFPLLTMVSIGVIATVESAWNCSERHDLVAAIDKVEHESGTIVVPSSPLLLSA